MSDSDLRSPFAVRRSPLVLASASPRRRELLGYLGVSFEAVATLGEEGQMEPPDAIAGALPPFPHDARQHPTLLAWRKAQAAADTGYQGLILGADTIVVLDGTILGKPRDARDARRMLRQLAGRTHRVYTGIALLQQIASADVDPVAEDRRPAAGGDTRPQPRWVLDLVCSDVTMSPLSDDEIAAYVATGEPLDKAGAYGIQGLGGQLVQGVAGSYTNVVGLPFPAVHRLLRTMGIGPLVEPADAFRHWLTDQGKDVPPCAAP